MTILKINQLIGKLIKLREALSVAENTDIISDPKPIRDKVDEKYAEIKMLIADAGNP